MCFSLNKKKEVLRDLIDKDNDKDNDNYDDNYDDSLEENNFEFESEEKISNNFSGLKVRYN